MSEENGNTVFQNQESAEHNQTPVTPDPNTAPVFSLPEGVDQLVGEGKKYQTVEDALKSVPHAQQYIGELKQEMERLKEDLSKRKTAEELLAELKVQGHTTESTTTQQLLPAQPDIGKAIAEALSAEKAKEITTNNLMQVDSKLKEKFGEKTGEVYKSRIAELGMSNDDAMKLAAKTPAVFLALFNTTKGEPPPAKTSSTVNLDSNTGTPPPEVTSVMGGASTEQMMSAWNNAKRNIN